MRSLFERNMVPAKIIDVTIASHWLSLNGGLLKAAGHKYVADSIRPHWAAQKNRRIIVAGKLGSNPDIAAYALMRCSAGTEVEIVREYWSLETLLSGRRFGKKLVAEDEGTHLVILTHEIGVRGVLQMAGTTMPKDGLDHQKLVHCFRVTVGRRMEIEYKG